MINIITFSLLSMFLHAHHISVCELTYKQETKSVELIQQVFADDLESYLISESGNSKFDVRSEEPYVLEAIQKFVQDHIALKANESQIAHEWIGYVIDGNNVKIYLEYKDISGSKLTLTNTIFLNTLVGQENIVHFLNNRVLKTGVCTKKNDSTTFDL